MPQKVFIRGARCLSILQLGASFEVMEGLDGCLSGSVSDLGKLLESLSLARSSPVDLLVSILMTTKALAGSTKRL